jgi:DNA-binding GntR family transcriptional regulator
LVSIVSWGLGTVERRSTTDQVLHELRAAIVAGRIPPREPLPEVALAQTFGTGRSAIREALRTLVQEGLVVSELNRGAWVKPLSTEDVIDVYLARTAIEVAAVRAARERATPPDLTALRAAQARISAACVPVNGSECPSHDLIAADIDFHRELVALAGSPRLSRAHEPLAAESQMLLNWHPVYPISDYASDHQRLLDALESGDANPDEAVRAHLTLTVDLISQEAARYASRLASAGSLTATSDTSPTTTTTDDHIVNHEGSSG